MDEGNTSQNLSSINQHYDAGENTDSSEVILLELVKSNDYALGYTFFLIPEAPLNSLPDGLTKLLTDCLQNVCELNGWELEFVTVDPEYLQWAVSVPPAVTTMQVVQQVRSKSTGQIAAFFDGKMSLGDSTDFWAQGYLLLHGSHSHSSDVVERYIRLVRRQQIKFD